MKEKYLRYSAESFQKAESLKKVAEELSNSKFWLEKAAWFEEHGRIWKAKANKL